jgi:hypothetical protein
MEPISWKYGPNALGYIHSTAQIVALFGPPGTHKSFASIDAILAHQLRSGSDIRIAIVRDTLENIRISLVPSFYEYFATALNQVHFKNEYKELLINLSSGHKIEADLFGVNDPADLQRLQGASAWSLIWINDPAPMTERGNAGVPESAYEHAAYRAMRKSGTPGRLQIDMNYAEETHWTYRRLILEPDIDPESPDIRKEVFHTNYDEVQAHNIEAEQMARRVFKDEASKSRYVEGRFAEFKPGKQVTPAYRRAIHLCPSEIIPSSGLECFAFCDGWFNPTCVLGQITKSRRLIYIDTVRAEGTDIGTLLETQVAPLLRSPIWKDMWAGWRIGGDTTMTNRDEGNINNSAAQVVEKFFKKYEPGFLKPRFEGGSRLWSNRRDSANHWLIQNDPKNRPMIYVSGINHLIDKGLNGAWHYPVDNSGNIKNNLPFNDEISHVMEGWVNSVCVLLGEAKRQKLNTGEMARQKQKQLNRVIPYAVRGSRYAQG